MILILHTNNIATKTLAINNSTFTRIVYGTKYVALDNNTLVYTSTDCIYFTLQSASNLNAIISTTYSAPFIIWDGSKYIACGYCISSGPALAYSTDAITWTAATGCSNFNLNYIAYSNGLYLAQGRAGYLLKSSNGTSWSTVTTVNNTSSMSAVVVQMCYNPNTSTWLVTCGNSGFYKSTDGGSTWTLLFAASASTGYGCTYNSNLNLYVISGNSTWTQTSTDLVTCNTVTTTYSEQRTRLFSAGSYIFKCSEMHIEYTTNGSTWTTSTLSPQSYGSVVSNVPFIQ